MIKHWLLYLLTLAGTFVFHIFYFGWYSWFLLVLIACLPVFSFIVSILAMIRIQLQMETDPQTHRGEPVYLSLQAIGSFLPMPRCTMQLIITSHMTGRTVRLPQVVPNGGRWFVSLDTAHCDTLICTLEKARVYDYLGMFCIPVPTPEPVECMICPIPSPPDKLPNLSHFLVRRRQPKPGGGFSEEHELRDYRPGDSMRDIHWKLSAKTDRTIVREAQEPIREQTLLTFDLCGTPDTIDHTLQQLCWMSDWLCQHEVPHQIIWIDPTDCEMAMESIETPEDLQALLPRLLHSVLHDDTPSIISRRFSAASWRYHISGEQGVRT